MFEAIPYMDLLLNDMGLNNHRKKSFLAEVTTPYSPGDYTGLIDEWNTKEDGKGAEREQ